MLRLKKHLIRDRAVNRIIPACCVSLLLFFALSIADIKAEQGSASPTVFEHEAFNICIPSGWKTVKNPQPGIEIGFIDEKIPGARWCLHYEIMPEYTGEPPSDTASLRDIANQFDTLIRQQYPDARKLPPPERKLPGKKLAHLVYELKESGTPVLREYVYLLSDHTAYVIQADAPVARRDDASPALQMLFRTFKPGSGAEPLSLTADQALVTLKSQLPLLLDSMPPAWRGEIREIKFLTDSPRKGDTSLLIAASWPRNNLKREFASAKQAISALRGEKVEPNSVTKATGELVGWKIQGQASTIDR